MIHKMTKLLYSALLIMQISANRTNLLSQQGEQIVKFWENAASTNTITKLILKCTRLIHLSTLFGKHAHEMFVYFIIKMLHTLILTPI